ncbi:MAG: hypothetical protein D6744_09210 [Planctomycetota bacterium]|nr:MAG: hypothetical protein D6744_09210 [Planctomycetota bacterium]
MRLRRALAWAEDDLPGRLTEVRDAIEQVQDRVDAWVVARQHTLARGGNEAVDVETHVARLRIEALPEGVDPATSFRLIPFGVVQVERASAGGDFEFTPRHAQSAKQWFDRLGRKLAIDYEHQSFDEFNARADGLRPAAGWIGGLEVRDDGLWAIDVTWTERAADLLRSGEYRYFSPVIYWTDADCSDVAALGPVALTNDPAMRGVPSLTTARRADARAFESSQQAAGGDPLSTAPNREAAEQAVSVLRAQLDAATEEITTLRDRLRQQEADAFVERGLRLGKILDSTSMDWRADYLRDAAEAEQRLDRAPVLLAPGRVIERGADGRPLGAASLLRRGQLETLNGWGIEPDDIAAYEQARAAGRVRVYGAARGG